MNTLARIRLHGHEAALTPEGWECPDKTTQAVLNRRRETITHMAYLPNPARDIALDAVEYFKAESVEIPSEGPWDPNAIY